MNFDCFHLAYNFRTTVRTDIKRRTLQMSETPENVGHIIPTTSAASKLNSGGSLPITPQVSVVPQSNFLAQFLRTFRLFAYKASSIERELLAEHLSLIAIASERI